MKFARLRRHMTRSNQSKLGRQRMRLGVLPSLFGFVVSSLVALAMPARTGTTAATSSFRTPEVQSPRALIQRALDVIGLTKTKKMVHMQAMQAQEHPQESDRMYPPFFSYMASYEIWYDPQSGVERDTSQTLGPGRGPNPPTTAVFGPAANSSLYTHKLNVFMALLEWEASEGVRETGREVYRDYERIVLVREVGAVQERLFLDPKSGFPVKIERIERNSLWGQVKTEYVFSDWILADGLNLPAAVIQVAYGETTISRTIGKVELVPRDQAPSMALPNQSVKGADARVMNMNALNEVKTVQVGTETYLLTSQAYIEAVALVDGTIYLLDATTGEERSKNDAELIRQLFPGTHPVVVIVTDLAWPHVAGLRYWVASGATVISHKSSEDFLSKVIERRWTLAPDVLERNRSTAKLKFTSIDGKTALADGKIEIYPIDGIASEGALMVYLPDDHFLWASDYIQDVRQPSFYANDVANAVHRAGIQPERFAAEHVPLTPWAVVNALLQGVD